MTRATVPPLPTSPTPGVDRARALVGGAEDPSAEPSSGGPSARARTSPGLRVFVADGHPLVLTALRQVIGDQPDLTLVGAAGSEVALFASPALAQSDVLVVDLSLGKDLIERARVAAPHLVIVAHSILPRDPFEAVALRAGAAAYVAKGDHPASLLSAIRHRQPS